MGSVEKGKIENKILTIIGKVGTITISSSKSVPKGKVFCVSKDKSKVVVIDIGG